MTNQSGLALRAIRSSYIQRASASAPDVATSTLVSWSSEPSEMRTSRRITLPGSMRRAARYVSRPGSSGRSLPAAHSSSSRSTSITNPAASSASCSTARSTAGVRPGGSVMSWMALRRPSSRRLWRSSSAAVPGSGPGSNCQTIIGSEPGMGVQYASRARSRVKHHSGRVRPSSKAAASCDRAGSGNCSNNVTASTRDGVRLPRRRKAYGGETVRRRCRAWRVPR